MVVGVAVGAAAPVAEHKSPQPPRNEATQLQQQPTSDQRGTEQSPFIIQILPPVKALDKVGSAKDNAAKHEPSNKWWFYELGTGDEIASIATLVGLLQFAALVATYWVMRRAARQQLRAYISGLPDFVSSFDETHRPRASYTLRNVGQTPAFELVHRSGIAAFPYPLPLSFKLPPITNPMTAPIVLFSNIPLNGYTEKGTPFSDIELAGIRSGLMRVYIFGEIRYRDVFHKRRWTTFCSSVQVRDEATLMKLTSNSSETFENIVFEAAAVGNDAR
nr:hypothetical protein [uncultured Rhodopila sp.]